MKETVEAIETAGLRDGVKIMTGGGQIDDEIREYSGADAYGDDAMEAVNPARKWIGGN
jgi:methanogenic corrinoid protein MtbC1